MLALNGKIVFITGCTGGIGKQTALELATAGATVLLHARSVTRGSEILNELKKLLPGGSFDLFVADLADVSQIESMALHVQYAYPRLDILVNNAATYSPAKLLNSSGIEMTFAVNHLASFYLTHLLLPLLRNSSNGKIINLGSHAHYTGRFNRLHLQGEQGYNGIHQYCNSKLHTLLFTYALASKLKETNITVNAVHPGMVKTKLYASLFPLLTADSLLDAVDTIVYLCTDEGTNHVSGQYFMSRMPLQSSYNSYCTKYQQQLWKYSEQLLHLQGSEYQITESEKKWSFNFVFQYVLSLLKNRVPSSKHSKQKSLGIYHIN